MAGLLQKMVDINSTILVLPMAMANAYSKLLDANMQLVSLSLGKVTGCTYAVRVASARSRCGS